eukprot:scaffold2562_cov354-Prasinococcus_capsulatus_cf.AAC.2
MPKTSHTRKPTVRIDAEEDSALPRQPTIIFSCGRRLTRRNGRNARKTLRNEIESNRSASAEAITTEQSRMFQPTVK